MDSAKKNNKEELQRRLKERLQNAKTQRTSRYVKQSKQAVEDVRNLVAWGHVAEEDAKDPEKLKAIVEARKEELNRERVEAMRTYRKTGTIKTDHSKRMTMQDFAARLEKMSDAERDQFTKDFRAVRSDTGNECDMDSILSQYRAGTLVTETQDQ